MIFKRAERKQAKLKAALVGPSGSGKTMSSLLIARGIGGKIAVVDTENGSASLYSQMSHGPLAGCEFDVLEISAPFTPDKYIQAIKAAEQAGYGVLIIDSLSHVWQGEGGVLDKKAKLDARGGNQFGNWLVPKSEHNRLKEAILQSNLHVITTIRAKQGYVLAEDGGKQKPTKVGLDPVAEPGVEYEYTVVFDLAMDHNARASKDRTSMFDAQIFRPTVETGKQLIEWLTTGKIEAPKSEAQKAEAPKVEMPKPDPSGLTCELCKAELRLHATGAGYICVNAGKRGDGHTRIPLKKLEEAKARQQAFAGDVN